MVFVGLTLFTFQTKVSAGLLTCEGMVLPLSAIDFDGFIHRTDAYFVLSPQYDFSSFGPFLAGGLMGLIGAGLVQIFFPFSKTTDLVISCFGVLLFSGYGESYSSSRTDANDGKGEENTGKTC